MGHRIVHGGPHFEEPVVLTPEVRSAIAGVSMLAPLHIGAELEGMKIVESLLGSVTQVAVFDTGFHRQMPPIRAIYPGPYDWFKRGIRRYGFHGINHQYCAERAAQLLGRDLNSLKIVSCHLGNGCSVTAIQEGRSVDTTMGFTPLDGLMMGTRSGSVDPGVVTYLMRQDSLNYQQIDKMLNQESGLLGISGVSSDMRDIHGRNEARATSGRSWHSKSSCIACGRPWAAWPQYWEGSMCWCSRRELGENSPEVRAASLQQSWNFSV